MAQLADNQPMIAHQIEAGWVITVDKWGSGEIRFTIHGELCNTPPDDAIVKLVGSSKAALPFKDILPTLQGKDEKLKIVSIPQKKLPK